LFTKELLYDEQLSLALSNLAIEMKSTTITSSQTEIRVWRFDQGYGTAS